jgi:hypothetical protein
MAPRNEHRAEMGSLEAALRELNAAMPPEETVPSEPEDPAALRPGEHTLASPRTFEPADEQDDSRFTLWGRCGYVPASRVRGR